MSSSTTKATPAKSSSALKRKAANESTTSVSYLRGEAGELKLKFVKIYKYKCSSNNCKQSFESPEQLSQHEYSVHPKNHQCPECLFQTAQASHFKEHRLRHHRRPDEIKPFGSQQNYY